MRIFTWATLILGNFLQNKRAADGHAKDFFVQPNCVPFFQTVIFGRWEWCRVRSWSQSALMLKRMSRRCGEEGPQSWGKNEFLLNLQKLHYTNEWMMDFGPGYGNKGLWWNMGLDLKIFVEGFTPTLAPLRAASSDPKWKMKPTGWDPIWTFRCVCACVREPVGACVYVCAQANGKTWPISIVGVGLWRKRKTAILFMPTIGNTIIKIILRVLTGMLTNSPIQHYKEPPSPHPPTPHAR